MQEIRPLAGVMIFQSFDLFSVLLANPRTKFQKDYFSHDPWVPWDNLRAKLDF